VTLTTHGHLECVHLQIYFRLPLCVVVFNCALGIVRLFFYLTPQDTWFEPVFVAWLITISDRAFRAQFLNWNKEKPLSITEITKSFFFLVVLRWEKLPIIK
jgi:hypothetical protein